ncbi:hypothetical protein AB7282_00315 [Providencia huaxiensis]|uniref:hypothetical protein n=1 Tax=Providencia huaxiensis TaxID=2027290 RepID=UPI001DBC805A|nr:hypothetical protein [Providencia rettgeri]ELR5051869.1 hypothetical protein [Providencia rettgeri]ELR5157357.1 hypothetical protein [Providencia rettgeri]ELR5184277.1 hypothetical protein [Providencia rettgeri]ELR5276603.1 hypothetical protein [Providencia rettgeri]
MNRLQIAIADLCARIGFSVAQNPEQLSPWVMEDERQAYSYPTSTKRITGHAKINRAAKKRRNKK